MKKKYYEKYLCSSEKLSKVVDISICDSDLLSMEYRKLWESKGFVVSCFKLPCDPPHEVSCEDNISSVTRCFPSGKWEKRVICIETGKVYQTIKECMRETGIGGFRMRKAIYKGAEIEGLHFKIIEE